MLTRDDDYIGERPSTNYRASYTERADTSVVAGNSLLPGLWEKRAGNLPKGRTTIMPMP
jgi:hypothetical protein